MNVVKELEKDLEENTKKRVERVTQEFSEKPALKVFENTEGYDQMIAQVGIPVSAVCEHHQVAFGGEVNIAYIPNDSVIGLSKLARVAEYHLNPTVKTIQEKATHRILKDLKKALDPRGIMVVIKATHNCISYRGVKKPSLTITSAVDGVFADNSTGARSEFLQLINNN